MEPGNHRALGIASIGARESEQHEVNYEAF
jgi:hypothetical protein